MKASTLIGLLSIAANVALLGILVAGALQSPPRDDAARASGPTAGVTAAAPAASVTWADLVLPNDLAAQRDRLVTEGFPPSVIRAILAAQIRERFATRRKAIEAEMAEQPFWKSTNDPRTQAQLRALYQEEQKALKELLGPDPVNGAEARLQRQFPGLAAEKIEQLAAIRERFDTQRSELYSGFRGTLTPSEREKVAALDKAMHAEVASVLSPAELENYDLRTSNTANNLRYMLVAFEPTEAEFRTLYRLQSAFDEQFNPSGPTQDMRARSEAMKELNARIQAELGPARYADYQRATDYNYQQTTRLVARLGLPAETAGSLYAVQKDFEARRSAFFGQGNVDRERLAEHLGALQKEATTRVNSVLGGNAAAIAAYQEYGGSWLANYVPRISPPPAKK